jgi:hypothetical protein
MPLDPKLLFITALTKILSILHSKIEMPPKSKVVPLEKLDNFYIGRF